MIQITPIKMLTRSTPIELYKIKNNEIYVKREDLATIPPGPPFAKSRGLEPKLLSLKVTGVNTVGYCDTSISMGGFAVSYFCKEMGLKSVIFYPVYKDGERHNQTFQFKKWKEFGAEIIPLEKPNRLMINWYRARKILKEKYPDGEMLPQGLPFKETIDSVSDEIKRDEDTFKVVKTIVLCIGSGTMLAGILKGLYSIDSTAEIYGVIVAPKSIDKMKNKIYKMANVFDSGFFAFKGNVNVIDAEFEYTDKEIFECPFPCNPYYDRKAWKWMIENINDFEKPLLFWNIGA